MSEQISRIITYEAKEKMKGKEKTLEKLAGFFFPLNIL